MILRNAKYLYYLCYVCMYVCMYVCKNTGYNTRLRREREEDVDTEGVMDNFLKKSFIPVF